MSLKSVPVASCSDQEPCQLLSKSLTVPFHSWCQLSSTCYHQLHTIKLNCLIFYASRNEHNKYEIDNWNWWSLIERLQNLTFHSVKQTQRTWQSNSKCRFRTDEPAQDFSWIMWLIIGTWLTESSLITGYVNCDSGEKSRA